MNNFISPEINSNFSIFPEQAPIPPIPTAQELFVQRQDGTASSWKQGLFSLLTRVDAIIESKPMFALGIGAICAFTVSSMGLIIIPVGLPGSAIILFAVCRLVTCLFNQIIIKNHDHYLLERFSANGCPLPEKQALLAAASPQMRQEHRGQLQNQVDAYCAAKAEERRVAGQLTEALEYAHRIDAKELRATALKPIHRDLGDRNAGLLVEIETSELVSCPRNVLDVMLEACKYIEEPILRDTCRVKILEAFYTRELAEATMHGKKQLLQALFRYSSSAVSSHGMQYEPGVSPISPNCIESRQKLQELWITILEIASRPDPNTDEKFVQFLFALLPRIDALYLPAKKTQAVLPMVAAKLVILPAQIFASFLQLEHIIQKTTLDIALDMIMMMPPASRSGALNQLQQKINSMNLNANLKQYLQPILDWYQKNLFDPDLAQALRCEKQLAWAADLEGQLCDNALLYKSLSWAMPQNPPDDYADILLNMEDPEEHGELCEAQQREELPLSTYQVVKTAYYESVQEYFFYSKNPSEKLVTLGKNARLHSIAMRAYAQLSG